MTTPIYPLGVRGLTWPIMKTSEFGTIVQQAPDFYTTRIINSQNPIWHWALTYEYLKDYPTDIVAALSPYTDYRYLQGFLLQQQGQFGEFLFDDLSDDVIGLNPVPGGTASNPSVFKVSIYPTQEFYYPLNSYVVDNHSTPHLQLVTRGGVSGSTVPAFSTSGGTVTSGTAQFTDQGVFSGANAQQVPLVNDGAASPTYYSPVQRNFGGQFLEDVTDLKYDVYPALVVWANGVLQVEGSTSAGGAEYALLGPGLAIPGYSYEGMYLQWFSQPTAPITMLGQFYFRTRLESDTEDIEEFLQTLWTIGGASGKNGKGMLNIVSSRVALVP